MITPVETSRLLPTLLESLGIESYFTATGSALVSFRTKRRHAQRTVVVEICPSVWWVTVRGYLYGNVPRAQLDVVCRYLARLNAHSRMARYCLIENAVVLQVDIANARLTRQTLSDALGAMVQSASESVHEIATMASSPTVAALFAVISQAQLADGEVVIEQELVQALANLDLKPTPIERFASTGEKR